MLQLTYELRPKWNNKNNKNNNKTLNAVSRSDPLQGSDKYIFKKRSVLKIVIQFSNSGTKAVASRVRISRK